MKRGIADLNNMISESHRDLVNYSKEIEYLERRMYVAEQLIKDGKETLIESKGRLKKMENKQKSLKNIIAKIDALGR